MKRLFVLTPQAKADLQEILLDIAADSPDTAERLRVEMYHGLQGLGRSPGIGHYLFSPDIVPGWVSAPGESISENVGPSGLNGLSRTHPHRASFG